MKSRACFWLCETYRNLSLMLKLVFQLKMNVLLCCFWKHIQKENVWMEDFTNNYLFSWKTHCAIWANRNRNSKIATIVSVCVASSAKPLYDAVSLSETFRSRKWFLILGQKLISCICWQMLTIKNCVNKHLDICFYYMKTESEIIKEVRLWFFKFLIMHFAI